GGQIRSSPTVAGNVVYVGSGDAKLDAFALGGCGGPAICVPLWTATLDGDPSFSAATVSGGVVYIGTVAGSVYAVSTSTHAVLSQDGNLYGLRATTLATLWSVPINGLSDFESPAVSNGVLYIGGASFAKLNAVSLTSHTIRWSSSGTDVFENAPAVANGVVYS